MRALKIISAAALLLFSAMSCAVFRDYDGDCLSDLDRMFPSGGESADSLAMCDTSSVADIGWREFFTDPMLRNLIDTALSANADMRVARERILQSQAAFRASKWAFFPSLSLSPSFNFYNSEPRYGGNADSWSVPASASWEVDLSGTLLNRNRKARTALEQSEVYLRSVKTELVATVAEYYYTLLKLDAQLEISRSTAASWEENVRITRAMKEAGMTNEASVAHTEANACSIEASLFDLEYQVGQCRNALCVLIGIAPTELERGALEDSHASLELPGSVPVRMLSRRCDVQAAELEMRQAYYDSAISRAAFYPAVNITASAAWDKSVTSPAGWLISLGAGAVQPLLARGRLSSALDIALSKQEEAAQRFRQVILKAGAEVSDALALCSSARGKADVRIRQIEALESAVVSTRELMRHSESTYLEVLTAQQSLLSARLQQVSDHYDLLRGSVSLYRALGGGAED